MTGEKDFLIQFSGLKVGKHQFDYQINRDFFNLFDYDEFENVNIQASIVLNKKTTMLELTFQHKGTVTVPCDLTNELFDLPVKGKMDVLVKFGDTYNDENEELLILPHGEFQLNVAQYIYEMIVLSVPQKRIHPGVENGTLTSPALEYLEHQHDEPEQQEENNETDPRWDILKQLLTDK